MRLSKQENEACASREAEDNRMSKLGRDLSKNPTSGAAGSLTENKVAHTRMPGRVLQATRSTWAVAA